VLYCSLVTKESISWF